MQRHLSKVWYSVSISIPCLTRFKIIIIIIIIKCDEKKAKQCNKIKYKILFLGTMRSACLNSGPIPRNVFFPNQQTEGRTRFENFCIMSFECRSVQKTFAPWGKCEVAAVGSGDMHFLPGQVIQRVFHRGSDISLHIWGR